MLSRGWLCDSLGWWKEMIALLKRFEALLAEGSTDGGSVEPYGQPEHRYEIYRQAIDCF